jgi:hypothetical protein
VRIRRSRFLLVVAFALLPVDLGGLSGCGSKPADGTLVEAPEVSEEQKAQGAAELKQQSLERRSKFSKKGRTARTKKVN